MSDSHRAVPQHQPVKLGNAQLPNADRFDWVSSNYGARTPPQEMTWANVIISRKYVSIMVIVKCKHLLSTMAEYRRRQWHPTPVLLPGKSHGWRSLVGCSPWDSEESDTTERLHFHFSLSCTGEGNGNPLQCSCLENPRDGGAWWAAVYGVAQSRTRWSDLAAAAAWQSTGLNTGIPKLITTAKLF